MLPVGLDGLTAVALAVAGLAAGVGAMLAMARHAHTLVMLAAVTGCVALAVGGVSLLLGGTFEFRVGEVLGYALIDLRMDALAGVFLVALGVVGAASSMYAIGYHDASRSRLDRLAYVTFLVSLALVFGSANAFSFLFAWELMAISSAMLVIGPTPDRSVLRAGYIYLAMTHLATAAIVVAFAVWSAAAGSLDFAFYGVAAASLDGPSRDLIFVLLLLGFGTKAGMMPLHVWLPRAHPVAPSHVSALMSGVMIKAGIFGLVRFAIELLGPGPGWWGLLVLALGAGSAVLGVLYALAEHDLKRLLAFHSIENIGIILMGLGVALVGQAAHATGLVVVGLAAALFHTFNHALFKALLFLCAGAVQSAAGTRDLNRLGGLSRTMPVTALCFGLGAAAISGLPPLNGFASEWLTFQGLLSTGITAGLDPFARFAGFLAVGALALTAALAVACFVKATGMTFLAVPRTPNAARAHEVGRSMRGAAVFLAAGCIAVGVAAGPLGGLLASVGRGLLGGTPIAATADRLTPPPTLGSYDPVLIGALLACACAVVLFAIQLRAQPVRAVPTWTCGIAPEPGFQYSATSFSKPLRLFFAPVFRAARDITVEFHPGTPFPRRVTYRSEVDHVIETRVYAPLHRASIGLSEVARRLQQGSLQLYLLYTVVAVVVLLLVTRR